MENKLRFSPPACLLFALAGLALPEPVCLVQAAAGDALLNAANFTSLGVFAPSTNVVVNRKTG